MIDQRIQYGICREKRGNFLLTVYWFPALPFWSNLCIAREVSCCLYRIWQTYLTLKQIKFHLSLLWFFLHPIDLILKWGLPCTLNVLDWGIIIKPHWINVDCLLIQMIMQFCVGLYVHVAAVFDATDMRIVVGAGDCSSCRCCSCCFCPCSKGLGKHHNMYLYRILTVIWKKSRAGNKIEYPREVYNL